MRRAIPDGPPAVFASDKAEYAIFMALVHSRNCPQGYQASSGTENGRLIFRTTQETFAQLGEDARGFVYVLDKNDFTLRDHGGVEYASAVPVKPLEKLLVTRQDLPENVQITH